MAREDINIGVEGNDGTGDSIREAFRKVNENFQEIYAIFGLGGAIGFTDLGDTPDTLAKDDPNNPGTNIGNLIPATNAAGTALVMKELIGDGLLIDASDPNQILFTNPGANLAFDTTPTIGGPLDLQTPRQDDLAVPESERIGYGIGRVRIDQIAVDKFNTLHELGGTDAEITIDDLVVDKKYVDQNYHSKAGNFGQGSVQLRDEPTNITDYTFNITNVDLVNLEASILNHGFNNGVNGKAFSFSGATANDLIDGNTYYLKNLSDDNVAMYASQADALNDENRLAPSFGAITIADYDSSLEGNWLSNEALPRKSTVRRQGDTMEGELYLNDHPGILSGIDTGVKQDFQAATKYYVDQNSGKVSSTMIYVSEDGTDDPSNIPYGLHGRSSRYAFRTIGKAAELAEEQVEASPVIPGNYMQTITHTDGGENSIVDFLGFAATPRGTLPNFLALITANKEFLKEEAIAYTNETYPDLVYDTNAYKNDIGILIYSIVLDIRSGQNVNFLTRTTGLRYFANVDGRIKVGEFFDQTLSAVERIQEIISDVLNNIVITKTPSNPANQTTLSNVAESGIDSEFFNLIENVFLPIISGDGVGNPKGLASAPTVIEGTTYKIEITNGASNTGSTDQGDPDNFDLRQGKVIRGKTSGAIGRIVDYVQGGSGSNVDEVYVQLLEPVEYQLNEELEYGNFIKDVQISIRVDSGTYDEQYPIRVPANVSIKGDEFRRVIVRPAPGPSTSKWAGLYFFRDNTFDDLDILPTANAEAIELIERNKRFIVAETIAWIDDQIANNTAPFTNAFVYNDVKCARDLRIILDGIVKDVKFGGNAETYENAKAYYIGAASQVNGQEDETAAAIAFAKTLVTTYVLTNTTYTSPLQSDQTQVIDTGLTAETGVDTKVTTLMEIIENVVVNGIPALSDLVDPRYAYHYLTDPLDATSTPKDNADIDVFLMNDASLLRNLSPTGHGGFMCVLDPDGQILTKSPYIQTGSSFSQSLNKKAFRGGMYVDAWAGNIPMVVTNVVNAYKLEVESLGGTGLFFKKPQLPAPFYIDGVRYQVNSIELYNQQLGKCTLVLDKKSGAETSPGSGVFQGFVETVPPYTSDDINPENRSGGYGIILQTAGGRSMLANDFTQINDLGYGVVGRNGALIELVSMFTYYCEVAYYADSGSQIRSLNGSNAYGNFGLVAEAADPNEIPDRVELVDNMVQPALIFDDGGDYTTDIEELFVYVYATSFIPHARGELEIDHGGTLGIGRYEITTVTDVTASDPLVVGPNPGNRSNNVYKLSFSTEGSGGTSQEGLLAVVPADTPVILRTNQNFRFDDVVNTTPIRPSTAVAFDEVAGRIYRSIAFNSEFATGDPLPPSDDQSIITVDQTYDFLRFSVDQSQVANTHPDTPGGYAGTLGATVGDTYIAVEQLTRSTDGSPDDVDRAQSGRFITGWNGKIFNIDSYVDKGTYAIIGISDYTNPALTENDDAVSTSIGNTGITATLQKADYDITLRAGLKGKFNIADPSIQDATVTFRISTCRATGHDFLDIGTGGFNNTNYPNVIFGNPQIIPPTPNPAEVFEKTEGRVFYVSTDQDGFFRVGEYFTVDQGTGTVTFSAAIALSNLDGLGFKRGVVVTAFLTDTGMTDNASDAVPTQSAVVGYVNRRLGYDAAGNVVANYLSRYVRSDGGILYGDLDANGRFITGLSDISTVSSDGSQAANKNYVDNSVDTFNSFANLYDTELLNPENGDLIVNTGLYRIIVDYDTVGDWQNYIGLTINDTVDPSITGTVIDAQDTTIRGTGRTILTYQLTSVNNFTGASAVESGGGVIQASIIENGGPYEEIANAHIGDDGDVRTEVFRPALDGSSLQDTVIDFYLNDTVVLNKHVAHDAGIDQYKLDLNAASTYAKANLGSINQNNLGVATFNEDEFDVTNGFVEIGVNSITLDKIQHVGQYQAFGRLDAGTGATTIVDFSDIFNFGGDFTTSAEAGKTVQGLAGTGGLNAGPKLQIDGNDTLVITGGDTIQISDTGNVLIELNSDVTLKTNLLPDTTASNRNIGSSSQIFNTAYITTLEGTAARALYADLAENYVADSEYEPGTVLVFGGEQEVTHCVIKDDRKVAGIVSTDPAYLMNSGLEGDNVVALALQGRVPCKVIGKVEKGDILVTSAIPGYAIVNNDPKVGTIIGKAVGTKDDTDKGMVEVVVGRV